MVMPCTKQPNSTSHQMDIEMLMMSTQLNIAKKSTIRSLSKSSVVPRHISVTISVISTLHHCWLTIFDFKVWLQSFTGDNSMFGFKEIESLAKYYLELSLFTPEEAEAMPQEWSFLRSRNMHICTNPL